MDITSDGKVSVKNKDKTQIHTNPAHTLLVQT